jgi:hypothetical protein
MTPEDWAKLAVALITIFGAHAGLVKFLTKHYLSELKPNGGNSIKDEVKQIKQELAYQKEQMTLLTDLVKEALRK